MYAMLTHRCLLPSCVSIGTVFIFCDCYSHVLLGCFLSNLLRTFLTHLHQVCVLLFILNSRFALLILSTKETVCSPSPFLFFLSSLPFFHSPTSTFHSSLPPPLSLPVCCLMHLVSILCLTVSSLFLAFMTGFHERMKEYQNGIYSFIGPWQLHLIIGLAMKLAFVQFYEVRKVVVIFVPLQVSSSKA